MWQPAPLLFPDAEQVLCAALRTRLSPSHPTVFVGIAIPAQRRPVMVIVRRDGGGPDGVVDRPRVNVRCWAETSKAALDLGRAVVKALPSLVGDEAVAVRDITGPMRLPDESEQPSVYVTATVHLRAT